MIMRVRILVLGGVELEHNGKTLSRRMQKKSRVHKGI